ncbi:MAG: cytochrome c biogenesis protein CcdA [Candidatus Omnitrophota bacterium]
MNLSGTPLDYLIAFFGGVLVSFTPCVYPLIPITVGYIGVKAGSSKSRGFFLSASYVTGIAVTYSLLGLLASLTGTIFGSISSSPIAYFFVGAVIILFGLSMLDLFIIPVPRFIKLPSLKKQNTFSAFILGLSSGLIAAPCLTPVLGSILVYLTTKRNLLYGITLLFSFAYGMGSVLILLGTFSGVLVNLPKSGKWMGIIKRLAAFVLILLGAYFIVTAIRRL